MKLLCRLKSKIHRAVVTEANVDYIGSITVDADLLDRAGIEIGELVHVWNVDTGARFETYAISGERYSGVICVNGAAAHHASAGHRVIIAAFAWTDENISPQMILVDGENRFVAYLPWTSEMSHDGAPMPGRG